MQILCPAIVSAPEQHAEGSAAYDAADVDQFIRETKQQYDGRETIAFVGEVGAGKTVVAALVKHTLSTRWVPRSKGRWEAQMVSGHDEINETIRRMKRGAFPPATMKDEYPSLMINIHRMKGMPGMVEIVLRDMSGEDYAGHLSESDSGGIDGQLAEMLKGNGAYLVHATKYVLMIDCEGIDEWETDEPKAVNAIKKIHEIKKRINHVDGKNRFINPLAIVFTKADTLPEQYAQKSAKDLASEYYDLMSWLRVAHAGPRSYFKVFATTSKERPDELEEEEGYEEEEETEEEGYEEEGAGETEEEGYEEDESDDASIYLAVPLDYSIEEYEKLITWLVSAR